MADAADLMERRLAGRCGDAGGTAATCDREGSNRFGDDAVDVGFRVAHPAAYRLSILIPCPSRQQLSTRAYQHRIDYTILMRDALLEGRRSGAVPCGTAPERDQKVIRAVPLTRRSFSTDDCGRLAMP